ncbi:MAG TPA: alpha/beta hydrolase [Gammaproteobacteria bacterium]|nr:alpha/beta hydrolase [Gammaproteobacteria bacterium]
MSPIKALLFATLAATSLARAALAANVDGANVHWTSTGNGPQAVIFVHGWTCDESSWSGQVPAFSSKYRVITLDLPGHGKSAAPANGKFSMANFANAVEAVRAKAGVDRVVVVGHSMGTPVVRTYQLMYPQHVAGLVIVDGAILLPGAPSGFTPPNVAGPEGRAAREGMIRGMFSAATTPQLQDHILKMMLGAPESTAIGAMGAMFNDPSWQSAEPTKIPVLGVFAANSQLDDSPAMKTVFPTAEFHEVPGTGHFLMLEKPAEFNKLLGDFLAKLH